MSDFLAYVANQLNVATAEATHNVRIRHNLTLGGELRTPQHRYLIEGTAGVARWEHISRLSLALQLLRNEPQSTTHGLSGVLVAAAIPPEIKDAAAEAGIQTMTAPAELLGDADRDGTRLLLTKPKSWAVIVGLLSNKTWPNLRALADATGASKSWTQVIVAELAAQSIVEQRRGHIALADPKRLIDSVASERPLQTLQKTEVETGIESWDELMHFLSQQWSPTLARMERPGLWACGATAAMAYSNYLARHDKFQAYTDSPAAVQAIFEGRRGGIPIVLYTPDRPMGPEATIWNGIHVTSLPQTVLDVMGEGYKSRDITRRLLEVLGA